MWFKILYSLRPSIIEALLLDMRFEKLIFNEFGGECMSVEKNKIEKWRENNVGGDKWDAY